MKKLLTLACLLQASLSNTNPNANNNNNNFNEARRDGDNNNIPMPPADNIVFDTPHEHEYGESLANSCVGKEDGEYWIQFSSDDESYLPVYLQCSNEYVILDYSKDNNLESYFSSFEKWHYAIAGPSNSNPVTWEEWFLPSQIEANNQANYLISPDCNTCDVSADRQVFDTKTAYWMSGNLAKLTWSYVGYNDCDMNPDTYTCYDCTSCRDSDSPVCYPTEMEETETDYTKTGICGVAVQASNREIQYTRTLGMLHRTKPHYKPSLGTDGRFCVCYQPAIQDVTSYYLTDLQETVIEKKQNEMSQITNNEESINNNIDSDVASSSIISSHVRVDGHDESNSNEDMRETNVVYLSSNDFADGTYRILESGTYIITEDIEFDFNANDDYWPRADQDEEYPGAAGWRDSYFMGFFAGITVEADYVTIDLNGHELKQSLKFHYQQRWFAIVELGSQQFLPGQGPGFFGPDAINVADCTIKDGTLGLTSHFAIHGNYPQRFTLENVHIKDFVTHGMQLNGWSDLTIKSVEVGPASTVDYLKGDYGHARLMAIRLRSLENDLISDGTINDHTLEFADRGDGEQTVTDIAEALEYQMNLALSYAINRVNNENSDNDYLDPTLLDLNTATDDEIEVWNKAKTLFIQESGYPSSSSLTGLFLNFDGASVFTYTKYTNRQSSNAVLEDVYVHDLIHEMYESMRIGGQPGTGPSRLYTSPWLSDFPAQGMFGDKDTLLSFREEVLSDKPDVGDYRYVGTVVTDAYIALGTFCDDWGYLGQEMLYQTFESDSIAHWATGDDDAHMTWRFGCNQDVMFHSGKGTLGIRIDGTTNVKLDKIKIENLEEKSAIGSMACGEYEGSSRDSEDGEGGHLKQQTPIQVGFSGNNLQAISIVSSTNVEIGDVFINNIYSDTGEGAGISVWTANDITFKEDALVVIKNLHAGKSLEKGTFTYESRPNRSPEACAFRMEGDDSSELYDTTIVFSNEGDSEQLGKSNVIACNIKGHEKCLGTNSNGKTLYGHYLGSDSSFCDAIESFEDLTAFLATDEAKTLIEKEIVANDMEEVNVNEIKVAKINDKPEREMNPLPLKKVAIESENTDDDNNDVSTTPSTPNILFIMLDDLGRADIGKYGAEWDTPNIDAFIDDSLQLSHHYIGYVCSASRSQFLTGRHSYHNGYGTLDVFDRAKLGGIPQGTPTIADYLSNYASYKTYAVGKWQLGYAFNEQTPNYRGFDYFYGFYGGLEEYFDKTAQIRADKADPDKIKNDDTDYYDFWENMEPYYDAAGEYSTYQYLVKLIEIMDSHNSELETDPFFIYAALQAPHMPFPSEDTVFAETCDQLYEQYYDEMKDRDGVCEAMLGLDYFMGALIDYMQTDELKEIWDNTLIIFTSDNGGALSHGSCNYPLRGGKNTYFEGNQRVHAFVGGGYIPDELRGTVKTGLMANVDWLPTLMSFGGLIPSDYIQISFDNDGTGNSEVPITFDGYNLHEYLMSTDSNLAPVRDHVMFQLRPKLDDDSNYITNVDFKLLAETIHLEVNDDTSSDMIDVLDQLHLDEIAMVFYDEDGKLWKFFNAEASTNEIGNVQSNCNWCAMNHDKMDSDNIFFYTNSSDSVTKGLFDLDEDMSETTNLFFKVSGSTRETLMKIVSKNALQYFDSDYSESSVYLYGNFGCFYDKHNIQAWPGKFDGVWAPFLTKDEFGAKLLKTCGFDESHMMYKLHMASLNLPTDSDFSTYITDKTESSVLRNQLVASEKVRIEMINKAYVSIGSEFTTARGNVTSLTITLICIGAIMLLLSVYLCYKHCFCYQLNAAKNGYRSIV